MKTLFVERTTRKSIATSETPPTRCKNVTHLFSEEYTRTRQRDFSTAKMHVRD